MEYPPEQSPDTIRLIGIDPGTATLGTAILDVNMDTFEATVVYGHTNDASKVSVLKAWDKDIRGGRDSRIEDHAEYLYELFTYANPTSIAAESPFLRIGRVTSFEALVECYRMMRKVVWQYSPSLCLRRIDPISAKNYVGVSHIGTDKEDVRAGVVKHYGDKCAEGVYLDDFDEHTIDALAVAHCLLQKYIHGIELISTKKKKKPRGKKTRRKTKRRKAK